METSVMCYFNPTIPIVINIGNHLFEMVSEIHDSIQLVFGMKNMVETEGDISTRKGTYNFINISMPIFPTEKVLIPQKKQTQEL